MLSLLPFMGQWKHALQTGRKPVREVHDTWRLRDGTAVTLRAARTDDGTLMQELVHDLSPTSRYRRFFSPLHEMPPNMLDRFTHNARTEAITILAVVQQYGRERAVAMAQYVADPYPERCDFAVVVADDWQRFGLGRRLIQTLICLARAAGFRRVEGDVLAENEAMMRLMLSMGFRVMQNEEEAYLYKVSKELEAPTWKCSPLTVLAMQEG